MNSKEVERRLREGQWPEPSQEMRARVLTAATVRPQSVVWSDRVWFSRAWRLSMAAVVVAVFAIRAWPGPDPATFSGPSSQALAEAQAIEETGREIGLPEAVAASLARRALTQPRSRPMTFNATELQFLGQEETRRE